MGKIKLGSLPPPISEVEQRSRRPRKATILLALLAITAATATGMVKACSGRKILLPPAREDTAEDLLRTSPLIDSHNDFPIFIRALYHNDIYQKSFNASSEFRGHVDFPRLRKGKSGGQFWSAFVPCPKDQDNFDDDAYSEPVHDTLQQIDLVHRLVQRFPDHLIAASTARDVRHNFATYPDRISSLIGIEGLHQIGNSASTLRLYHQFGVRYATLTHNCHNKYADSAAPSKPLHGGLSAEGVDLVREMNRMGMMVDLSHTSADTQRHALNVTLAPVLFSHSNAYTLCKHTRNVPDDVLKLVKKNNGVVMVTFLPDFVKEGGKGASLEDVADHIEYIGNLIGYQHVGLGSDFDGMESAPTGLEDVSKYPALIKELLRRGVSAENVRNLMGLNILRVLGDVEKVAADLATKMNPLQDQVKSMF